MTLQEEIGIVLRGEDKATPVFNRVIQSANQLGNSLSRAFQGATNAFSKFMSEAVNNSALQESSRKLGETLTDGLTQAYEDLNSVGEEFAAKQRELLASLASEMVSISQDASKKLQDVAKQHSDKIKSMTQAMGNAQRDYARTVEQISRDLNNTLKDLDFDYAQNREGLLFDLSRADSKEEQARIKFALQQLDERYQYEVQKAQEAANEKQRIAKEEADEKQKAIEEQIKRENDAYKKQTEDIKAEQAKRLAAAEDMYAKQTAAAESAFNKEMEALQKQIEKLNAGLSGGDTKQATGALGEYQDALKNLNDALMGVYNTFAESFAPTLTRIADIIVTYVIPVIQQFADWFKNLPQPLRDYIFLLGAFEIIMVGVVGKLISFAASIGGAFLFLNSLGITLPAIGASASAAVGGIGAFAASIVAAVGPLIVLGIAIAGLILAIDKLGPAAAKSFMQLLFIVGHFVVQAWQKLTEFGQNLINQFPAWFEEAAASLAGMLGSWVNIGLEIVYGIWEGIESAWGWLIEQVQALAEQLLEAAKEALESESPSKAFAREVGKPISQGIGLGMAQELPRVAAGISRRLSALPAQVNQAANMDFGAIVSKIGDSLPAADFGAMQAAPVMAAQPAGAPITFIYSPSVSMGNRAEAENTIVPYIREALRRINR